MGKRNLRLNISLSERMRLWSGGGLFWYAVLACYLVVLVFLSLNPWIRPVSTNDIGSPDKLDHAFAYGGLTIIVYSCLAFNRHAPMRSSRRAWIVALLVATFIGILIEIAQSLFTSNRSGSVEDAIANAIGACLGLAVLYALKYLRAV